MAEIVKTEVISLPNVKLIGRRYTDKDRNEYGNFSNYWGQWFSEGLFDKLRACKGLKGISNDFIGAIRCTGNGFEYWIGILMAPSDVAPEGFEQIDIEACSMFVCYVFGNRDNGELYSQSTIDKCYEKLEKVGLHATERGWKFERYNCPRFTNPNKVGNVILDYCISLED
ncbi:MAG: GyrI-like domain-containing protein [Eubacteriales bacterium]|nr:GyrI-like domain-containing protein [Eubacteriales bacterium]